MCVATTYNNLYLDARQKLKAAGVEAALLAPTAMNQQKFVFSLKEDRVSVKPGLGFYSKVNLGIVKYHFELGAGDVPFQWA